MDPVHHKDPLEHASVERWERRWLALSGLLSLTFIILIAYALAVEGAHIAQLGEGGRGQPEVLLSNAIFESPGVRVLGNDQYQVSVVAQTYSFNPPELLLPLGAEVTFYATSRDVIHGYQIDKTNINVELIPGEIATFKYSFDELGTYRVGCNEYCGIGHQNMLGQIRVVHPSELARAQSDDGLDVPADPAALGERVYTTNCASCHQADGQGQAGLWPPLAEHAAQLYNADRDYLPRLLLYGLTGAIDVAGEGYNGVMPAWKQLGNDDLAEGLNYILRNWGNETLTEDFEPYSADDIEAFRNEALAPEDVYDLRPGLELP